MTQKLYKGVVPEPRASKGKIICYSTLSQDAADKNAQAMAKQFHETLEFIKSKRT